MAQIIKHRRGTLAELNGVTLNNGELGIVTSSVASIGDAVLKTAVVVGNTDGTNRLSIGRIIKGNATPDLSGITGGAAFNDMLYHETDAKTLKVLNTGGNTSLDLTGNIAGGTVGGTLTTTGNLSVQAHISSSANITGSAIYASSGFYGDGSNLTGVAQDIDTLASYGAATIHQTDDEFLISDSGTEKRITFSNLEDSIFANVSGDILVAAGGAATIQANSVALSTDTTGNYVATVTGGTGIDSDGATTGEGIAHSLTLDLNELTTETSIAQLDFVTMVDATDDGSGKITFSDFEDEIFGNVSGDAAIAAGGALTIAATSVEGSMLNDNVISGQGALGGASMAQADLLLIDDGPGTLKSVTFSNLEDSIFGNISGDATVAAGGALTIAATSVENSMLADDAVDSDELASGAVDDDHLSDGVATGLAGAGMTATSGVLNVIGGTGITANANEITTTDGDIVHDNLSGFVANEHIDHSGVTITAGTGLTGGGTIAATRTLNVIGGDGITANANDVAVTAAQTTITSVYNASLKVGTSAAQEYVTFGTANEVNTFIDNSEVLSVTSAGIDVTGNTTVSGNLTVNGTTTYISSSTLEIGDNIIVLNSAGAAVDSGIQVIDAVSTAHTGSLLWNATNDYWYSGISGSTHYRHPVQASTSDLTENKPVIVDGSGRLESSANITDNGTTVDFNDVDLTSLDKLEGVDANTYVDIGGSGLIVTKGTIQPATNNGNDLGATGTRYKDLWLQGNADLEGDIDVNGTANLDNTDIDGTLDVSGVSDFQSRVDAQASLAVTGSVYVSAGASVTAASASLVSFRNANTQLGYLASADTQAITTGLVGYNTSTGNLTISSVIDGGTF